MAAAASVVLAAPPPSDEPALGITFRDIAAEAGITFVHNMSMTPDRYLAETMGCGGAFVDYDLDGDLDIFFQNGAPMPGYTGPMNFDLAFYRNEGNGRFTDVTAETGLKKAEEPFGMGICAADYDNDGYPDLYAANFGPNALYHNEGDGTFRDVSTEAGITDSGFGSSCAWLDIEQDGDLDVVVVNYVDHTRTNNKFCGDITKNVRSYCPPNVYNAERDVLYRNNGDGTFDEIGEEAGLNNPGNALGVSTADFDDDGDMDIYVANDQTPNNLYRNDGGKFEDVGLLAGVAYNLSGRTQAGMGTDWGDMDGDGDLDLAVTNYDVEYNALYKNEGGGFFSDASFFSGVGTRSLNFLAFGIKFVDFDNDGLQDLIVANGHIMDNIKHFTESTSYAQRNFVHHNLGNGKFEEIGLSMGPDMAHEDVGRSLSKGDVDRDGDLDLLMTTSNGPPRLLINEGGNARPAVRVRLVGTVSNRSAIGARGTAKVGNLDIVGEVHSGGSFQSQSELTLHFGLGSMRSAEELTIRWPSGRLDSFKKVKPGEYVLVEGEEKLR